MHFLVDKTILTLLFFPPQNVSSAWPTRTTLSAQGSPRNCGIYPTSWVGSPILRLRHPSTAYSPPHSRLVTAVGLRCRPPRRSCTTRPSPNFPSCRLPCHPARRKCTGHWVDRV